MARCRSYLRGLAICVTVLQLVSGVVMIGVGFSSIDGDIPVAKLFDQLSSSDGLLVLQVFGPITVVLSVLGITAASMDLKTLLLVFSALVFIEFVALMVVASPLVQVQTQMDGEVDEVFLNVTPLYRTDPYIQTELNKLQDSYSCCGLRNFEDWQDQLPASCFCTPPTSDLEKSSRPSNSSSEGSCVMVDSDHYPPTRQVTDKLWVHSEPCGPILKNYLSFPIKLRIGIISAVATIMMAAIALCLALGLEEYWKKPPVETTVDDFNRVKYEPKPTLT
ncbi:23 kDa integral membrane protein-like [Seriola lalandi dorsalis]|uniref:23 kDa integral membrane protein-like n=1 Tax=Seriola lalandi dorsalis TaxID=1841481 RepID=UPI000C6F9F6C|nr:23 kDa integral membrane protein-like [Seriola lalandi dorsalis]XP_056223781.1 23 kDa integral membrane protein-like [Seriola aureovittata]XP_056223782.1 23 kDa integral membrane protein-like [Seriola aureovittata]